MNDLYLYKKIANIKDRENNTFNEIWAGAKFTVNIQDESGNCTTTIGSEVTSEPNGQINVGKLNVGKYCLLETNANGAVKNLNPLKFEVIQNQTTNQNEIVVSETSKTEMINYRGRVELTKVDKDNKQKILPSAKFRLYKKDGNTEIPNPEAGSNGEYTTNVEGKIVIEDLMPGTYYFKETYAPEKYIIAKENFEFTIADSVDITDAYSIADVDFKLTVENYRNNELELDKQGLTKENGQVNLGEGYSFYIYKQDNAAEQCDVSGSPIKENGSNKVFKTDLNGKIKMHLDTGKYCIVEQGINTDDGFILNKEPLMFEVIKEDLDGKTGPSYKLAIKDEVKFVNFKGKVTITKHLSDQPELGTEEYFKEARFALYKKLGSTPKPEDVDTLIEDDIKLDSKFGTYTHEDLEPGNYYFVETKAPLHYIKTEEKAEFTILAKVDAKADAHVKDVTFNNDRMNELELNKVGYISDDSYEAVEGATFDLYQCKVLENNAGYDCDNADEKANGLTSIAGGVIKLGNLEVGKYYLKETDADAKNTNYHINNSKLEFEVANDGKVGEHNYIVEQDNKKPEFVNYKPKLRVYKYEVIGIDENEDEVKNPLQGAKFGLFKYEGPQAAKGEIDENGNIDWKKVQDRLITEKHFENTPDQILENGTEQGVYISDYVDQGWYYIYELKAPEHFNRNTVPQMFKTEVKNQPINNKDMIIDLKIRNIDIENKRMSELEIKKVGYIDEENSEALVGAKFDLYQCEIITLSKAYKCDNATLKAENLTSIEDGVIKLGNLSLGKYYLIEKDANTENTGYHINNSKLEFEVIAGNNLGDSNQIKKVNDKEVVFENYKPKFRVFKYETITNSETSEVNHEPLIGAEFGLYTYDGPLDSEKDENGNIDWTKVEQRVKKEYEAGTANLVEVLKNGDANGNYTSDYVDQGWYYIVEHKAPEHFTLNSTPQLFAHKVDGQAINSKELIVDYTEIEGYPLRVIGMENGRLANNAVQIKKQSEDGKAIKGAEFDLFKSNGDKVNGTFTSNENGIIELGELTPDKYSLIETNAGNENYMLNTKHLDFEVIKDADNGNVLKDQNTKFINYQGKQKINKVDNNNRSLKGAKFDLFTKAGKKVKSIDMSSKSTLTIDKLAPGEYYLVETKAPKGFAKSEKHHNFIIPEKHAGAMDNDYINSKALTITNDTEEDTENKKKTQDEEKDKDGMGTTNYGTPTSGSMLLGLAGILGMIGIGSYAIRKRFND